MSVQRRLQAKVTKIEHYSDSVKLISLKPKKRIPRFKPGQFLHLAIEPYDPSFNWPESRVFSIANSPTRTDKVDILVSKVGTFTTKMLQGIKEGDEVWIKLPYGIFNFEDSLERDTVLIAGGTGISPFISYLQFAIDKELNPAIKLYYGVKLHNLLIIEDLIKEAQKKLDKFDSHIYVEEIKEDNTDLKIQPGRLPVLEIVAESLMLNNPMFYLSGPPEMISTFDKELRKAGVFSENIKYDNWE